jgi:hypothetical protein
MSNLRIRAALACRLVNLDRVKFNEAVAAGAYPCAPITVKGSARLFDMDQLLGLFFFARLMEFGFSAGRAGYLACEVANHAARETYREADRVILLRSYDLETFVASVEIALYSGNDKKVIYDPDHEKHGTHFPGLGRIIMTMEFYIAHVRKILADAVERERNILGTEEE